MFCASFGQVREPFAKDLPFSSEEYKNQYVRLHDSLNTQEIFRNFIGYYKKIYELVKKEKDTLRLIYASHSYARSLQYANENLNALPLFKEELDLLSVYIPNAEEIELLKGNHLSKIEVLCQLGNCFASTNEVDLAFEYYDRVNTIAQKENLSFYKAVLPTLIGTLKFASDDFDEALEYYNKALKDLQTADIDAENIKFNSGLTSILKSRVFLKKKMLDSAQYVIEEAEKKGFFGVGFLTKTGYETSKAEFLLEENKNEEAFELLLKVKEEVDIQDPENGLLTYYNLLAKAYYKLNNFEKAIEVMDLGLALKKTRFDEELLVDDYKFLADVYKAKGDLEKSNFYLEKYVLNQASIDKTKKEIIDLFHDKELSQLQSERETKQKFTNYLLFGGGAIILILLFFLLKFYQKRKKDEEKFTELHSKLKALNETSSVLIDTKESKDKLEEKTSTDVPSEIVSQIIRGLQRLEKEEYYLRSDCNSYNVAKRIRTNTSYLSKVINSEYQKNFNTYINDLRINYAMVRIENDKIFRSFSIQSIAEELGYKSADSFTKYFKRRTGLNPSFYIKQLKNL
jgi:AraC-like DNA-binding protein